MRWLHATFFTGLVINWYNCKWHLDEHWSGVICNQSNQTRMKIESFSMIFAKNYEMIQSMSFQSVHGDEWQLNSITSAFDYN